MSDRSTKAVFDGHLRLRDHGEVEADLERNYPPDVILRDRATNAP